MTPRARRALGIFVILALLGPLVVDWLWVTDEERVTAALDAMEKALEKRDAAALAEWFEEDVKLARPISFLPGRMKFADALATALAPLKQISLDRDDTQITFPEPDVAAVVTSGIAVIEDERYGKGILHVDLTLRLRATPDRRFLLESIERFEWKPGLG